MVPYQTSLAEWEQSSRQAVVEGREPPARPVAPDLGADETAAEIFEARRRELWRTRLELLASVALDVERDAQAQELELLREAKPIVDQLERITDKLNGLLGAVREVTVAQDAIDASTVGSARAAAMRSSIGLVDLLEAVQHGISLLDPEPVRADGMLEVAAAASASEPAVRPRVDPSLMRGVEL